MTSNTATSGVGGGEPGKVTLGSNVTPPNTVANEPPTPNPVPPVTPPVTESTTPDVGEFETNLGGSALDNNGNLLDSTGKVLLTKVELEQKKAQADAAPEPSFAIAESGDLVNEKGEVIAKVGEFEVGEDGTVEMREVPVINQLLTKAKELGYQFDEKAAFEDSADGLFDFAGQLAEQLYTQQTVQMFEQQPELLGLYQHLEAGGLAEDYYKSRANDVDYAKLEVPSEQKAKRIEVIRQYLTNVANNDVEVAEEMLKFIEDGGKVNDMYDKSIAGLRKHQEDTKAERARATADALKEQEVKDATHWREVQATIKKGELGNLQIPEADKDSFFKALAVRDKEGVTTIQRVVNEMPLEQRLQFQYLMYAAVVKGQRLEDLAANFKATAQANKILLRPSASPMQIKVAPKVQSVGGAKITLGSIR